MKDHSQVRVPAQLRNPAPAIAELRDDKQRFSLVGPARTRGLRILQGIVTAASHRGWRAVGHKRDQHLFSGRDSADHLVIETGDTYVRVRLIQLTDRSPHVPTARELAEQTSWGVRPPKYDHAPNDFLRLELNSTWDGSRHSWSDGKRGPLEQKLDAVVAEIERRQLVAAERRLQRAVAEAERCRLEQNALERAEGMYVEAHRAEVLADQVSAWQYSNQLRQYIAAMRQAVDDIEESPERDEAAEWIGWATRHLEQLDPLGRRLAMPDASPPTMDVLRPFLRQVGDVSPT